MESLFKPRKSRGILTRQSFSLDFPSKILEEDESDLEENSSDPWDESTKNQERFFLYLPRNLSFCHVCSDVIRKHVQRKVKLLNSRIEDLKLPRSSSTDSSEDEGTNSSETDNEIEEQDEARLWLEKAEQVSAQPNKRKHKKYKSYAPIRPILCRKIRAVSFPPPLPSRPEGKKIVRFADSLGLELESIRYIVRNDISNMKSTDREEIDPETVESSSLQLVPLFSVASLRRDFLRLVKQKKVCLHSVNTADGTIYGMVSVSNLTFHKTVFVRCTINSWITYHDYYATYVEGSSEYGTDKFSFTIYYDPHDLNTKEHKLYFVICFRTEDGREFWDNNNGKNYCLKCEIKDVPSMNDHSWIHFL